MVEPHFFIFLGIDEPEKQRNLSALQAKAFPPELKELNYQLVYGDDKQLTPRVLQEMLACYPSGGALRRLIVIRSAQKLSRPHWECLRQECLASATKNLVVVDIDDDKGPEASVQELVQAGAQLLRSRPKVTSNAFDLGRAIAGGRTEAALKLLSALAGHKERSEKILGALFWQWERLWKDRRIGEEDYKKGLKFILEADQRLKSISSAFARETLVLESLVVRLSSLASAQKA